MSKIIVIEANTDGAGKETQSKALEEKLIREGKKVFRISFPNYESDSSYFVKKYLNGDYGKDVSDTNPYVVSTFYAIDRYLTYIQTIREYIEKDYTIILDRYVTSNIIYQTSKIYMNMLNEDKEAYEIEKAVKDFIAWEENLEYDLYGLPRPDNVIYLHIPLDISQKLIYDRKNKINDKDKKDIHESDLEYLKRSSELSEKIAETDNWIKIDVTKDGSMRKKEDILEDIYSNII